jgi:hypothetical protein
VRSFSCPTCGALLFFENSECLACGSVLGFDRDAAGFVVLWDLSAGCPNRFVVSCNWLAGAGSGWCDCCALTRARPNDHDGPGMAAWARAQAAARRLLYQLDDLGLPVVGRTVDPVRGLAFDLLHSAGENVITGHVDGVITIDLAEGDDGHREALRVRLAEPYRTLLGHFRHEVGHWYWMRLIETGPALEPFRQLFGDERVDYGASLQAHYEGDPPVHWEQHYVSVYATAHPWEDWAETFAHYLHIRDTLQTAAAFGIVVTGPELETPPDPDAPLVAVPLEEPTGGFGALVDTWLPLTYALNAVNRSMGKDDLYPFLLSPAVIEKLRFVHRLVSSTAAAPDRTPALATIFEEQS